MNGTQAKNGVRHDRLSMLKKIAPIVLLAGCLMCCRKIPGVDFPEKEFVFSYLVREHSPPFSVTERLKAGDKYPQTFNIYPHSGANSLYNTFMIDLFVNKPYKMLHIKEMKYEWENNQGVFIKDTDFIIIPEKYDTQNGWYLTMIGNDLKVNFEKIFIGKEVGR